MKPLSGGVPVDLVSAAFDLEPSERRRLMGASLEVVNEFEGGATPFARLMAPVWRGVYAACAEAERMFRAGESL